MAEADSKDHCLECNEPLQPYSANEPRPSCPKCGSKKRKLVRAVNEKVIIDKVENYNKQITRLKEFQEFYSGTKVEEELEKEIGGLTDVIHNLNFFIKEKPLKEITEKDQAKFTDKVIVEKFKISEDDASSILKKGDDIVDASNNEIMKELGTLKDDNKKLHKANSRLTIIGILGTIGGVLIGLFGSYLITISTIPEIIIINATSGAVMP